MYTQSRFLQGAYSFEGRGFHRPFLLAPELSCKLPFHKRGQLTYFRAGNSADALIYLLLVANGQTLRYFPVGAKSDTHVQLAIVEDLPPETAIEVQLGAPEGAHGTVIIDIGWLEV
ncbi:MAG: molybdopterin oxidoreductase [Gammaproteobacteria bacterium]